MTPEDELRRADNAQTVLANSAYQEAWNAIRDELSRQRMAVAINNKDDIQALVLFEHAMTRFQSILEGYIRDGQLQRKRLADLEAKKKPIWPLRA